MTTRKPRATKIEAVAQVVSKKDPDRIWTVGRHKETGVLSCNCPAWHFRPVCGTCRATLIRTAGGLRCPAHGLVGEGATQACKHVIAYLTHPTTSFSAAAGPLVPQQVDAHGAAVKLIDPREGAALKALLSAADACGLRPKLYERQWEQLAGHLAPRIRTAAAALPDEEPITALVVSAVRQIVLED